jgi:protein TonB
VRFYLCLYALGFIAYGMFHFDLAGAGWGAALAVVTIVGMVVAASRPTNEGGLRVLIATGIVCALLAFYGQMHPADPVAEPDVGKPESPVIAEETPPVETSPVSSESVDEVAVAAQNEPSAPSEEVASLPTDAKTSTDAAGPNSDEVSNVTGAVDADVPPAQEAVTRPAQVTFAALRYPPQAVRLRHEGTVTLEVSVDASGSVASMRVAQSSGWPELDREAERSRTTVVISAYRDGRPVDSVVRIPVTFSLNK